MWILISYKYYFIGHTTPCFGNTMVWPHPHPVTKAIDRHCFDSPMMGKLLLLCTGCGGRQLHQRHCKRCMLWIMHATYRRYTVHICRHATHINTPLTLNHTHIHKMCKSINHSHMLSRLTKTT